MSAGDETSTRTSISALLANGPRAIGVGVEQFSDALRPWDPGVVTVDWRPPSGGSAVTEALRQLSESAVAERINAANERVLARTPVGRWGVPADLAGVAVFLASRASDFVTGTAIPVDGGFSIA